MICKRQAGFTLVELLVVIGVLSLLVVGLVAAINPAKKFQESRNLERKSKLRQIADALDRYYTLNGSYPVTSTWCGAPGSSWTSCGADWVPGLITSGELKILPQDPNVLKANSTAPHVSCQTLPQYNTFLYYSNGTRFKLLAHCTPEGTVDSSDPFYDPRRPGYTYQISSDDTAKNSY